MLLSYIWGLRDSAQILLSKRIGPCNLDHQRDPPSGRKSCSTHVLAGSLQWRLAWKWLICCCHVKYLQPVWYLISRSLSYEIRSECCRFKPHLWLIPNECISVPVLSLFKRERGLMISWAIFLKHAILTHKIGGCSMLWTPIYCKCKEMTKKTPWEKWPELTIHLCSQFD